LALLKFSTSKFFSDDKFVSTDHILQKFLSAENFPEWKWAFGAGSENKDKAKKKNMWVSGFFL
jgi:hypothetical protein